MGMKSVEWGRTLYVGMRWEWEFKVLNGAVPCMLE